jgi:hypothetical protein
MERWAVLNAAVEKALDPRAEGGQIPEGVDVGEMMEEWLTRTDPTEKGTSQVILSRMHVEGCVLARTAHLVMEVDERRVQDVVKDCKELEISEEPVDSMGWRELSCALDNLQLNWGRVSCLPGARDLCWKLLARFGFFAAYGFYASDVIGVDVVHDREVLQYEGREGHRLSDLAKVQALDAFFCLFRYLWIMARETPVLPSVPDPEGLTLQRFHFEAATDTYHGATMHDDVHCGAILQYMHRFSGLYHSVSQAVYFHKPTYQRRRAPMKLEDFEEEGRTALDWIPVLQQLYPELVLHHEAVDFRRIYQGGDASKWCWLHAPGRVWLVQGNGDSVTVFWDPKPVRLLALYLSKTDISGIHGIVPRE